MILPIHLTGRLGLPGATGVPSFTLDASGNVIGGEFWPQGASGEDVATGEPLTEESGQSSYTNDPELWNTPQRIGPATSLNTQSLREDRGTQWNRKGSYLTESAFDRWRRMGKPTECSMHGIGDTWPDGTDCVPGSSPLCLSTSARILQAVAAGANAAAGQPQYGQYRAPGPQVAIGASASPAAWILGGIAAVAVVYVLVTRK